MFAAAYLISVIGQPDTAGPSEANEPDLINLFKRFDAADIIPSFFVRRFTRRIAFFWLTDNR